jgi:hypothetical protein
MCLSTLVRAGGAAAILAGVLRAASSFASGADEVERQALYFIIDLLLLLGAFAAYAQHHDAVGGWGAAGFLTTVVGILLVRSSRAVPGLDLYPAGALSVAIGWVLLSLAWWRTGKGTSVRARPVCAVPRGRPRRSGCVARIPVCRIGCDVWCSGYGSGQAGTLGRLHCLPEQGQQRAPRVGPLTVGKASREICQDRLHRRRVSGIVS